MEANNAYGSLNEQMVVGTWQTPRHLLARMALLIAFFGLLSSCLPASDTVGKELPGLANEQTSLATPDEQTSSTPSPSATPSPTPTPSHVPSATPTTTITLTPSPTAMGGGNGQVASSCEYIENAIIRLDLESGQRERVYQGPQTESLLHSNSLIAVSPDGGEVVWNSCAIANPILDHGYGMTWIQGFDSRECTLQWSGSDFQDAAEFPYSVPTLWLPDGRTIYERSFSPEEGLHLRRVTAGALDRGSNFEVGIYRYTQMGYGSLSPDGRYFAFLAALPQDSNNSSTRESYQRIVMIDYAEEKAKEIVAEFFSGGLVWDADSKGFLYFGKVTDNEHNIFWFLAVLYG